MTSRILVISNFFIFNFILFISLFAQTTFINSYPYEDLWPPEFNFGNAVENCNVIPAIGGGYLMQGFVEPYLDIYSEPQCMFWKISEDGELEWRKQEFELFGYDYFRSIVSNGVDRYYAISSCGWLGQQTRLFILDENCDYIDIHPYWTQDSLNIRINAMQILDDGLIMVGRIELEGPDSPFIMKTDFDGNTIWQKDDRDFNVTVGYPWEFNSVITTSDDAILACGYQASNPGTGYLIKFNAQGDTLWTYHQDDYQIIGLLEYSSDTYFIVADSYNFTLSEFNSIGELLANYYLPINSLVAQQRWSSTLSKSSDGNLILIYNAEEGEIHKISHQGEIFWSQNHLNDYHGRIGECFNRSITDDLGNIIFCGTVSDDLMLIRTDEDGVVSINNDEIITNNLSLRNYPNPFNPTTTINFTLPVNVENPIIEIYNIKGQKVKTLNINESDNGYCRTIWYGKDDYDKPVSSGVYLYRVKADGFVSKSSNMMLLK